MNSIKYAEFPDILGYYEQFKVSARSVISILNLSFNSTNCTAQTDHISDKIQSSYKQFYTQTKSIVPELANLRKGCDRYCPLVGARGKSASLCSSTDADFSGTELHHYIYTLNFYACSKLHRLSAAAATPINQNNLKMVFFRSSKISAAGCTHRGSRRTFLCVLIQNVQRNSEHTLSHATAMFYVVISSFHGRWFAAAKTCYRG